MLRVLHGPFEALEPAFLDALRELKGKRIAVVTPSRRLADRLQRLAAVEGGLALLDVRFHTFFSLAQAVAADDPPSARLIADPVFHDRLVDQLLTGARARGLAASVRSSLRDLIDAGVDQAALEEAFGGDERLAAARPLLSLAGAYERRLSELGVLSSSGLTRRAAALAARSPTLAAYDELLYYGFYDLTGLQLEFFEAVASSCPCRLFFPYRRGHPAFRFADAFFEQKLMAHETSALEAPARPALDALFRPEAPPAAWSGLSVVSASGARDEAWAAAKEVLRLVEREGYAFEEIGVVARALEPYRHALVEAFREHDLPLELAGGEPLLRRPLAKAALNLLTLRLRDFPALVVDDLFSSPYYNRLARGPNPVYNWRQAVRFLGIHAGWLQWRGKLERRCEADLELSADFSIPKEDLAGLWRLVSGLERALGDEGDRTWAGKAKAARGVLEAHLRLPEEPEPQETAAWEAVLGALDSLAGFDLLGAPCSWRDFLEAFEDKLRAASLDASAGRRGVRAMGAMDARGESFRALLLIGLKEGGFPRQVREDPLLRDEVRARLRHPAGYWIAQKGAGHEEERLLFWLSAAAARERLVCVYPRSDEAGRAEVPSLYLRELCRAAGLSLAQAEAVPRQPAAKLERLEPALASPKEVSLRRALEGGGDWPHLAGFNAWGPAGALDGLVGAPSEYLRRVRAHGLSPSALDELAECPFRFFASRVLGLAEADEASEKGEFASWVRGKIYHAALERFYRRLAEDGWDGEERALTAAVDSVFREYDWQGMGVYPVLWQAERDVISERLADFTRWDLAEIRKSGLKPKWLEKRLEGPLPGAPDWRAQGVADRVDVDEDGKRYRVIDYKLRARKGLAHQLPLYAELAGRLLGPGWTLAGSRLYYLEDDERVGEGELDAEAFKLAAAAAAKRIAEGRFPIRPDDNEHGHCARCDFSLLCRRSHGPSRRRASAADAL